MQKLIIPPFTWDAFQLRELYAFSSFPVPSFLRCSYSSVNLKPISCRTPPPHSRSHKIFPFFHTLFFSPFYPARFAPAGNYTETANGQRVSHARAVPRAGRGMGDYTDPWPHPGGHAEVDAPDRPLADRVRGAEPRQRESISAPFGQRGLPGGK